MSERQAYRSAVEHVALAEAEIAEARFVPGLPAPVRRFTEDVEKRVSDLREILAALAGPRMKNSGRLRKGSPETPVEIELRRIQPQLGVIKGQLGSDERAVVSWLVAMVRTQQDALQKAMAAMAGVSPEAEKEFERAAGKLLRPERSGQ